MTRPAPVFTVTRRTKMKQDAITRQRYTLTIDTLPGHSWTYRFREMSDALYVSALLSRVEARNLILDAWANGSASITGNQ
jgi:hypothetical protein